MKDKTPLLLIEQLIMILVFALMAALCLRGFAYADGLSEQIYQQEQAAVLAQSAAETLKAEKEIRQECSFYDASLEQVTEKEAWTYRLQMSREAEDIPGFGSAKIRVDSADAEELMVLTAGWQEAMP